MAGASGQGFGRVRGVQQVRTLHDRRNPASHHQNLRHREAAHAQQSVAVLPMNLWQILARRNMIAKFVAVLILATSAFAQTAESGTQILVSTQPEVFQEIKAGLESHSVHVHLVLPLSKDMAIGEGVPSSS